MRNAILLPAIVLLLLFGCSQQPQGAQSSPPPQPPAQPPASPPPALPPLMNQTNGTNPGMNVTAPPAANQSPPNQTANATPSANGTASNKTGGNASTNQTAPPSPPPPPPSPASYSVDANDGGFYMGGSQISSLDVKAGTEVVITFHVLDTEVYHGGLDFRGCGQGTAGAPPGQSVDVRFTPSSSCSISSYWPSTGVLKHTLRINAG